MPNEEVAYGRFELVSLDAGGGSCGGGTIVFQRDRIGSSCQTIECTIILVPYNDGYIPVILTFTRCLERDRIVLDDPRRLYASKIGFPFCRRSVQNSLFLPGLISISNTREIEPSVKFGVIACAVACELKQAKQKSSIATNDKVRCIYSSFFKGCRPGVKRTSAAS